MRYLCVCQYGHSRSVAMVRALHHLQLQAVACGWMTAPAALPTLCQWANSIVVLEASFVAHIPQEYRDRVVVCDVGRDRWSNPYHPELTALCRRLATEKLGLVYKD